MAPDYDFDLVSIGSGPAGQRAAVQAAKLGRRAAVIEKRRCVGGVCIDTGTIPSKTLREAILAHAGGAGRAERLPWARPAIRPTAQQLLAGVEAVVGREIEVIEQQLQRNDVIRRHMMRARNRGGFGWTRWSTAWLHEALGLFGDYRVQYRANA